MFVGEGGLGLGAGAELVVFVELAYRCGGELATSESMGARALIIALKDDDAGVSARCYAASAVAGDVACIRIPWQWCATTKSVDWAST